MFYTETQQNRNTVALSRYSGKNEKSNKKISFLALLNYVILSSWYKGQYENKYIYLYKDDSSLERIVSIVTQLDLNRFPV